MVGGWLGDGDHIVTTEVADLLHFNDSSSLQTHDGREDISHFL